MGRLHSKRTILITGGLGFIGSHFVEKCLMYGHDVINVDKETYAANVELHALFMAIAQSHRCKYSFLKRDIVELQYEELPECDIIVNFAAESHVDTSIYDSAAFVRSNVIGVHNIIDLLKRHKVTSERTSIPFKMPIFVQISTDEVFGDISHPYMSKEDDVHRPSNPYSATKSAAEQLLVAWGRTYDIPYIITRSTNSYGPRQHNEKLISMAISRLASGNKALMHGDGSYIRNWIHVLDNVDATWAIIDRGELNSAYHIASSESATVKQIIEKICTILKKDVNDMTIGGIERLGVDHRYALDCTKLKALGWKPMRTLDDTLRTMVQSEQRKYFR